MTPVADRRAHTDLLEAYRLRGDRAARDRLVEEMMPLVRSLARRYAGRGEPVDDLVQVGAIGLIKAIDRFDLERGVALSTYAVPTIVGEIRRHFRDHSWSVHVPRRMKELSLRISHLVDELSAELGRSPTVAELAAAAEVEEEDVVEALETSRAHTPTSLSTPVGAGGELTLIDILGEDEPGYETLERGSVVRTGLEGLDERERRIVVLRFLHGLTQSEIAAELGISQMHVSRLLRRFARRDARPTRRRRRCRHERSFHPRFSRPARVPPVGATRAHGCRPSCAGGRGGARRSAARGHRGGRERLSSRLPGWSRGDRGPLSPDGDSRLEVVVEDDGPGFDEQAVGEWRADELERTAWGSRSFARLPTRSRSVRATTGPARRVRFTRSLR